MIIKFGGMEVKPYALDERDKEESVFTFNFKADSNQFKKFIDFLVNVDTNKEEQYFQVLVDDEPLTMRFGMVGYSEHEEYNKVQAVLVDKKLDDNDDSETYIHQMKSHNLGKGYVRQKLMIEKLLSILKENQLISDEQEKHIYDVSEKDVASEIIKLYKVKDVDDYAV